MKLTKDSTNLGKVDLEQLDFAIQQAIKLSPVYFYASFLIFLFFLAGLGSDTVLNKLIHFFGYEQVTDPVKAVAVGLLRLFMLIGFIAATSGINTVRRVLLVTQVTDLIYAQYTQESGANRIKLVGLYAKYFKPSSANPFRVSSTCTPSTLNSEVLLVSWTLTLMLVPFFWLVFGLGAKSSFSGYHVVLFGGMTVLFWLGFYLRVRSTASKFSVMLEQIEEIEAVDPSPLQRKLIGKSSLLLSCEDSGLFIIINILLIVFSFVHAFVH